LFALSLLSVCSGPFRLRREAKATPGRNSDGQQCAPAGHPKNAGETHLETERLLRRKPGLNVGEREELNLLLRVRVQQSYTYHKQQLQHKSRLLGTTAPVVHLASQYPR